MSNDGQSLWTLLCILTPLIEVVIDNSMILRLFVCLAISILLHIFFIIQPVQFLTKQANPLSHMVTVPVGLVDIPQQPAKPNSTKTPSEKPIPPRVKMMGKA